MVECFSVIYGIVLLILLLLLDYRSKTSNKLGKNFSQNPGKWLFWSIVFTISGHIIYEYFGSHIGIKELIWDRFIPQIIISPIFLVLLAIFFVIWASSNVCRTYVIDPDSISGKNRLDKLKALHSEIMWLNFTTLVVFGTLIAISGAFLIYYFQSGLSLGLARTALDQTQDENTSFGRLGDICNGVDDWGRVMTTLVVIILCLYLCWSIIWLILFPLDNKRKKIPKLMDKWGSSSLIDTVMKLLLKLK